MGKILPKVIWGVVALGGFLSLFALLQQPSFGLSVANIPAWAVAITLASIGGMKALNMDVVKVVSVA